MCFPLKMRLCEKSEVERWHKKIFSKLDDKDKKEIIDWLIAHIVSLSVKDDYQDDIKIIVEENYNTLTKKLSTSSQMCLNRLFLKILLSNLDYDNFQKNYGNLNSIESITQSNKEILSFYTQCLKLCNSFL